MLVISSFSVSSFLTYTPLFFPRNFSYSTSLIRMATSITMAGWLSLLLCSPFVMITQVHGDTYVPLTFLESAVAKGAVCLDGSAPSYSYIEGSGNGSASWIVYLEGGGWCYKLSDCYNRSRIFLGSSQHFSRHETRFCSLLDSNCTSNPDFCNWHTVYIHYCDGSSFMSNILDSKTNLSFRGARIFDVMMEEMLHKGMGNAEQAILTGTSAGGLATMLHCDKFSKLFAGASRVKCISDSGFFLHGMGHYNYMSREHFFAKVIEVHGLADSLPLACTLKRNSSLCLFPEYFAGYIQTPLFIIESAFDKFQLTSLLLGNNSCTNNLLSCNSTELGIIGDYRTTFIKTLVGLKNSPSLGMFVHSCYLHGHILDSESWTGITLANKTLGQAVTDWYFDKSPFREIDTENNSPRNCTISSGQKKSPASQPHNGLGFVVSPFLFLLVIV